MISFSGPEKGVEVKLSKNDLKKRQVHMPCSRQDVAICSENLTNQIWQLHLNILEHLNPKSSPGFWNCFYVVAGNIPRKWTPSRLGAEVCPSIHLQDMRCPWPVQSLDHDRQPFSKEALPKFAALDLGPRKALNQQRIQIEKVLKKLNNM